jgi:hypothetical protein
MRKNEYIVIPIATITRRRIPKDLVYFGCKKKTKLVAAFLPLTATWQLSK